MVPASISRKYVENALPNAAELVLHVFQGSRFDRFPLCIDTVFGREVFKSRKLNASFAVSFKHAYVRVDLVNAEIAPTRPRYIRSVDKNSFVRYVKKELEKGKKADLKARGKIGLGIKSLLTFVGIDAAVEADFAKNFNETDLDQLEQSLIFNIVEPLPMLTWQIGSATFGDPERELGELTSTYFERPSDHYLDSEAEHPSALCDVQPIATTDDIAVRLIVEVASQGVVYSPLDQNGDQLNIPKNKEIVEKILFQKELKKHLKDNKIKRLHGRTCICFGELTIKGEPNG